MQVHAATVYTESIEKLKSVLMAMQAMSQKREKLEKRVRSQLETEIRQLKSVNTEGVCGEEIEVLRQKVTEKDGKIVSLEADVAKVHIPS